MPSSDWIKYAAMSLAVVAALLYGMYLAMSPSPPSSPSPTERGAPSDAASAPYPATSGGLRFQTGPSEAGTLDELRARCVEEAKRNKPQQFSQPMKACEDFAQASAATLPPPAPVPTQPEEAPAAPDRAPGAFRGPDSHCYVVPVDDCFAFGPKGSIKNRECRERFKNQLLQQCAALTNRLEFAAPDNRACLVGQKMAVCHAASVYQPVEP